MITSIFEKSKPTNFLVVFVIMVVAFLVAYFKFSEETLSTLLILGVLGRLVLCMATVFLLDFIVLKNKLTNSNYHILLFGLFLFMVPQALFNVRDLVSNLFVLLALRRLISLWTNQDVKKKLFDAGFWIGVASLFNFWAILFFLCIPLELLFFASPRIKNWITPFAGLATTYVLLISGSFLFTGQFNPEAYLNYDINFNFVPYNSLAFIVGITVLLSFGIWSTMHYFSSIKRTMKSLKPGYKTVLVAYILAWALIVISPKKDGGEFLFLFPPLAIIISNYMETIKEKWFREVFLITMVFVPVLLLVI